MLCIETDKTAEALSVEREREQRMRTSQCILGGSI